MRFQRTFAIAGGLMVLAGTGFAGAGVANAAPTVPASVAVPVNSGVPTGGGALTMSNTVTAGVAAPAFVMPSSFAKPSGVSVASQGGIGGGGTSGGSGATVPTTPGVGWAPPGGGSTGGGGGKPPAKIEMEFTMRSGWDRLHDKERGIPQPLAPQSRRAEVRKGGDTVIEGVKHSYKYDAGSPCLDKVLDVKILKNGDKVVVLPQWIDHKTRITYHLRNGAYVPGESIFVKGKSNWECGSGLKYASVEYTCPVDVVDVRAVGPWGNRLPNDAQGKTTVNRPESDAVDRDLRRKKEGNKPKEVEVNKSPFGKAYTSDGGLSDFSKEERVDKVMDPKKCGRGGHPMTYKYWLGFTSGWEAVGNYTLYAKEKRVTCNVFVAHPWTFMVGAVGSYDRENLTTRGKYQWGGCETPVKRVLPREEDPSPEKGKVEGAVWCQPPTTVKNTYGWRWKDLGPKPATFNFAKHYADCAKTYPYNPQCSWETDKGAAEVKIADSNTRYYYGDNFSGTGVTKDTVVPADGRYISIRPFKPTLRHPETGEIIHHKPSSEKMFYSVSQSPNANPYQDEVNSPDKDGVIDGDPEEPIEASEPWNKLVPGWNNKLYVKMYRTPNIDLTGETVNQEPFRIDIGYRYLVEWYMPVLAWQDEEGGLRVVGWEKVHENGQCNTSVEWRTASARNAN